MKTVLTIAGSDCSGGAGIQADLKTMLANGVYGMSAITALTAQNTLGVSGIHEVPADFLKEQIDKVFTDIRPDAVKVGMVASSELIRAIAERLKHYEADNIVVDPVMVSTAGSDLVKSDAIQTMIDELLPLASVITPNIPEAEVLSGMKIENGNDQKEAALKISEELGVPVLVKGGHNLEEANDILVENKEVYTFSHPLIDNPNTHGTGCTLSSAIASNLAKGLSLQDAISRAKEYITGAISAGLDLGHGPGPLNHGFELSGEFAGE